MSYQPPVYSPLTLSGIASALGAALRSDSRRVDLVSLLSERFAADHVILTRSGTHALQTAIAAFARLDAESRPVALPAYSCFDLVTAAAAAGVRVRFYDVDPATLSPDIDSLARVLEDGVSTVVAGYLYGLPLDFPAVREACAAAGVPVIEDAAQGVGAKTALGEGGSLGDASILSFGRGKGWTGGGGGGLLLRGEAATHPPELKGAGADSGLRAGATTLVAWALGRPALYGVPASIPALGLGTTTYHEPSPAEPITSFSTRLALATAESAFAAPARRRSVAESWRDRLAAAQTGLRSCDPIRGTGAAGYLRYPVLAESASRAQAIVDRCAGLGVAPGYPVALHRLPEGLALHTAPPPPLPGAEELAARLITLPTHHWIDGAVMDRFIEVVESIER